MTAGIGRLPDASDPRLAGSYVEVPGGRLWTEQMGAGPAVLFAHAGCRGVVDEQLHCRVVIGDADESGQARGLWERFGVAPHRQGRVGAIDRPVVGLALVLAGGAGR